MSFDDNEDDWSNLMKKAAKMKATTKRSTGTKAKQRRSAGKVSRAPAHKVARTARQEAEGIRVRMKRSPDYWAQLQEEMAEKSVRSPPRTAHIEPREQVAH